MRLLRAAALASAPMSLAKAQEAEAPLCFVGCFKSFAWQGCTLDKSRPPGCHECLYVNNDRLTPNPAKPMLRQCEELCSARGWTDYYGLQDGTACYCGRGSLLRDTEVSEEQCAPCPDLQEERCGAVGAGNPADMVVYAQAGACHGGGLGSAFSAAVLGLGCVYLAVGVAMEHRRTGAKGLEALPHRQQWRALHALVMDGFQFARGRRRGGGYARVDDGGRAGKRDEGAKEQGGARAKGAKGGGGKQKKSRKSKERRREGANSHGASPGSGSSRKKTSAAEGKGDAPAPAPAPAPAVGTAAGGGGRWVHVPN
eukprot:COSAG04_NODE_812_length_10107_cov_2.942946_9_plen_312_part_00